MKKYFLFQLLLICSAFASDLAEKAMVIVIPSYNNEKWAKNNLQSTIGQNYENFQIIYINDCSSDATSEVVEKYAKKLTPRSFQSLSFDEREGEEISETVDRFKQMIHSNPAFFTLVNNGSRCGALANLYRAIHSCRDDAVVVLVDGDDWLSHKNVLQTLNGLYFSHDIWMTHGTLKRYPSGSVDWCEPVPKDLIQKNAIRQFRCPSHLRTFYAQLFKKIALEDLLLNGKFFSAACDMAIMFPMTEMAGERHLFIDQPIYMYNEKNPINANKVNKELQKTLDAYIRSLPPYARIE